MRPRLFRRSWVGLLLVLLAVIGGRRGSGDLHQGGTGRGPASRSPYRAVPIWPSHPGHARFRAPSAGPGGPTLVVVSSLFRGPGDHLFRIAAKKSAEPAEAGQEAIELGSTHQPIPPVVTVVSSEPHRPPLGVRRFDVLVKDGDAASPSSYEAVTGVLRGLGEHVQVYVDSNDGAGLHAALIDDLVSTFDHRIYPSTARSVGVARDVDGDGRFTILLSSRIARLGGGPNSVDGYVRSADMDAELHAPFSNHCDMMYLNGCLDPGPYLRTIVAHEYMHAVTNSAKLFGGPNGTRAGLEEEAWLDEGLAHLGEDLHGFSRANLDYRISAFLASPERYRLVVDDYFASNLFRSHGNRGGTYLFLRWCVDQFGTGIIPALVQSNLRGCENVENATGESFASLYRRWSVGLFLRGFPAETGGQDPDRTPAADVRGPVGAWPLAGPRFSVIHPGRPIVEFRIAGTSTAYFVVDPDGSEPVEVVVDGPADAELQVSAVPLPIDLACLELQATLQRGSDDVPTLRATIRECRGTPARVNSLAIEPLTPAANPRVAGYFRQSLTAEEAEDWLGTPQLAGGTAISPPPLALEPLKRYSGQVAVRVAGEDRAGRPVAAWSIVWLSPPHQAPPAVASVPVDQSGMSPTGKSPGREDRPDRRETERRQTLLVR